LEGQATVLGGNIARCHVDVQAQIGVCFEVMNLYKQLSGKDNLKLFKVLVISLFLLA
jgi:ABC-type multidrug transport system ATPase subunit